MYRKTIIPFLLSFACLSFIDSISQSRKDEIKLQEYRAVHLTIDDGLGSDNLNVMIKDVKGFVWFGAVYGGFCRFDGAVFKRYIPDPVKRGAISSDKIFAFSEDSLHNIWIGTDKGISRYDIKADTFTNFISGIDPTAAKKVNLPFWSTSTKLFCIENELHIVEYDIYSLKKKKLLSFKESDKIQIKYIIFDSATNSLWMMNYDRSQGEGLLNVTLSDGKRKYYLWKCYRNIAGHGHGAEAMQYDRQRKSIWINSPDGLLEFSLIDKQFHLPKAFNELIRSKDYDHFVGIDIDTDGKVWLATKPNGILIYDPRTDRLRQVFSDQYIQQKSGYGNLHLYCDRDGIVWASNWVNYGVYEILPYNAPFNRFTANPTIKDSLSSPMIRGIIPGAEGAMWLGTADGLNIFNSKTNKFRVFRQKDLPGVSGNFIVPVFIDTIRQKAWIRTTKSLFNEFNMELFEMDLKTRQCKPVIFRDGAKLLDTFSIASESFLPYKNGFLIADERHGIFEIKENSLFADLLIPFKSPVGRMVLEDERLLFLSGVGEGPNFSFENLHGKWIKVPHLLDSLEWSSVFYNNKDQTHWVGLKYEFAHYDKNFRKIKAYTQDDGYNGPAYKILLDNNSNIWFTNILKQVSRLNVTSGIITSLAETDGYQKQNLDWFGPAAKDDNGNLYFGGLNSDGSNGGLDRVYPERYSSSITSSVYLRSLSINQKTFLLPTGINNLEELSLNYSQNTISIETGIIDYYAKGKDHLRYKLVENGKGEDWQYASAYSTLRYESLKPGHYRLVMQASNTANEFNSPTKILNIVVHPPFWETWWFRILAALATISVVYSLIQYRSRSLKRQNIVLEQKVMHRTKELKHSLEDLKQTQAQLIQSEKMASLGELTAGIAHEIQNPLNFVNNFSEVNKELIVEMKTEIEKGNIEEVKILADDIEANEEKINHHGKRADAIVKGMLQHSRTSTGIKEPTDINALCDEYLRLSYHGLRAKDKSFNATLKTDFDVSLEKINIIPQDIGRVILNLLNNAFYALNEKKQINIDGYEPTVSVSTKKFNNNVEIKVADNGNGIPQKVIDKIFQPFFTTKPTGQGTGLGLSLSYDIVKVHGGEMKVETKEGEGSKFTIQLPIK